MHGEVVAIVQEDCLLLSMKRIFFLCKQKVLLFYTRRILLV